MTHKSRQHYLSSNLHQSLLGSFFHHKSSPFGNGNPCRRFVCDCTFWELADTNHSGLQHLACLHSKAQHHNLCGHHRYHSAAASACSSPHHLCHTDHHRHSNIHLAGIVVSLVWIIFTFSAIGQVVFCKINGMLSA